MGHVDRGLSQVAAAKASAILDALRIVCDEMSHCQLRDGTDVCLRLVEPSDVPACTAMLAACSRKSLYSRYERIVSEPLTKLAERLCCPDLKTELTVVAEACVNGEQQMIGVAQLLTNPSHEAAEYAVLVADPWQSKGLGSSFTDSCLRLAHTWGVGRVVVEFLPGNMRMIRILESRAFDMYRNMQEHVVSGQKHIADGGDARLPGAASAPGGRVS